VRELGDEWTSLLIYLDRVPSPQRSSVANHDHPYTRATQYSEKWEKHVEDTSYEAQLQQMGQQAKSLLDLFIDEIYSMVFDEDNSLYKLVQLKEFRVLNQ
jgi:hypothetical protein